MEIFLHSGTGQHQNVPKNLNIHWHCGQSRFKGPVGNCFTFICLQFLLLEGKTFHIARQMLSANSETISPFISAFTGRSCTIVSNSNFPSVRVGHWVSDHYLCRCGFIKKLKYIDLPLFWRIALRICLCSTSECDPHTPS